MNIVLTGFMASGKTTIGKRIAKISDYGFIDTDEMIEAAAKKTINEIFKDNGEEYFRALEREIIGQAAKMDNKVISTGGGAVLNSENIDALRQNGVIFNLDADFSVIESRILEAAKTRPLLKNQSIEEIEERFNKRLEFYANCDYKIHIGTHTTVNEAADEVLKIADSVR